MDNTFSMDIRDVYSFNDKIFNVPGQTVPINSDPKWDYLKNIQFRSS